PPLNAPLLVVRQSDAAGRVGDADAALATHLAPVGMSARAGALPAVCPRPDDPLAGVPQERHGGAGDAGAALVHRHVADGLHLAATFVVADLVRAQARAAATQLGRAIEHRLGAFGRLPAGQAIRRPE